MRVDLLPENEASNLSSQSSFRLEIDASSNPSPLGGWQINAPSTTQINIPLLSNNGPGFGLCEAYVDDPPGDYDLSQISSGIVRFNNSGYFELGFNVFIISQVNETNGTIVMILKNGQAIFTAPPATAFSRTEGDSYTQLPGYFVKNFPATANVKISAGDEIILAIIANNTTPGNDISIQSCTNLFCTRISNIGILGSGSAVSGDTNLENSGAGTQILSNAGIYPGSVQRNFKTLIAGTDITITDSGTEITINSTGGGGGVTLSNLIPAPTPGTENLLDNPGTGTGPFNFKALVSGAGIDVTSGPTDVTITNSAMQPTQVGGAYGNQNQDSIVLGYNNLAIIGTNQNSNVIGSDLPALTPQDSNILSTFGNLQLSGSSVYTNSNILVSDNGSEIQNATSSNIIAQNVNSPTTDLDNCLYIGDLANVSTATNSICINTNIGGSAIQMANNSAYIGTGQNAIVLAANSCHLDLNAANLYYHNLGTATASNVLYYNTATSQITYGTAPSSSITVANPGASGSTFEVLMNAGSGSGPFNFRSILPSGGLDVFISGGNKISLSTFPVSYSTNVTLSANQVLVNNSTTNIGSWSTGGMQNLYNTSVFTLLTGVWLTAAITNPYRIQFNFTFAYQDSNALATPITLIVQLYNSTDAVIQRQKKIYINHDQLQTYIFDGTCNLNNANKAYVFRIVNPSLAGTQTLYGATEYTNLSINKIL